MSLRAQRLFRLCQSVAASGHIRLCPSAASQYLVGSFQSCRFKSSSFILGQSEVLFQDGIEIQELPWVIRRLDPREFPFVSHTSNGGDRRRYYICGVKDEQFVQQLQECITIHQVLRLLEVPGEKVTASSAAFALQRLSQLCSATGNDDMDSFVRKAVLHELCETVVQGISQLPNSTVVSLAGDAALASSGYDVQFVRQVNNEVEKRVGDYMFSILDLCSLIRVLSLGSRGDVQVTRNVWIHLGSRYTDIDASNIARVYSVMRYITPDLHYLWKVVEKRFKNCWWKLNGDEIATIASRIAIAGCQSTTAVTTLGRWLNTNVASVNDAQLKLLLAAHGDFGVTRDHGHGHGNSSYIWPLERYVSARVGSMDRTAVAMCVDFFRRQRWLSTRVLDAVAHDFETNASLYEPHELVYTLRTYGHLNYIPPNSSAFFTAVENILMTKFSEFDALFILELLASFVYIERFPINFLGYIFSPHFLMRIKGCPDATIQERAFHYLRQIQLAIVLEFPQLSCVHRQLLSIELPQKPLTCFNARHYRYHKRVGQAICQLVGKHGVNSLLSPQHMLHFTGFEIFVDETNTPMNVSTKDKTCSKKIALLLLMPEHYCANVPQTLGEYAMKHRHVRKLGYEVINVDFNTFFCFCRSDTQRLHYLYSLLSKHCWLLSRPHTEELNNSMRNPPSDSAPGSDD